MPGLYKKHRQVPQRGGPGMEFHIGTVSGMLSGDVSGPAAKLAPAHLKCPLREATERSLGLVWPFSCLLCCFTGRRLTE